MPASARRHGGLGGGCGSSGAGLARAAAGGGGRLCSMPRTVERLMDLGFDEVDVRAALLYVDGDAQVATSIHISLGRLGLL